MLLVFKPNKFIKQPTKGLQTRKAKKQKPYHQKQLDKTIKYRPNTKQAYNNASKEQLYLSDKKLQRILPKRNL